MNGAFFMTTLFVVSIYTVKELFSDKSSSFIRAAKVLVLSILAGISLFMVEMGRDLFALIVPISVLGIFCFFVYHLIKHFSKKLLYKVIKIFIFIVIIPITLCIGLKTFFYSEVNVSQFGRVNVITFTSPNEVANIIGGAFENKLIPNEKTMRYTAAFVVSSLRNHCDEFVNRAYNQTQVFANFGYDTNKYVFSKLNIDKFHNDFNVYQGIVFFNRLYFSLFAMMGIMILLRNIGWRKIFQWPFFMLAFFLCFLIFLGEVQTRYLSMFYVFFAILTAIGFCGLNNKESSKIQKTNLRIYFAICSIVVVVTGISLLAQTIPNNQYMLFDTSKSNISVLRNGIKIPDARPYGKNVILVKPETVTDDLKSIEYIFEIDNIQMGKKHELQGFLLIPSDKEQITEILFNDKIVFSSLNDWNKFSWLNSFRKKDLLLSFLHNIELTGETKNQLKIRLSPAPNTRRANLVFYMSGLYLGCHASQ
ncbi:MAG: hypothetical protein PHR20_07525 [Bacteroidales bacterium]|nr:hypothetical protein [Bacteroidales bacterium]